MEDPRNSIYSFVLKEFVGPDLVNTNANGDELLVGDIPTIRYLSGILFPQPFQKEGDEDSDEIAPSQAEDANAAGDLGDSESPDNDQNDDDDWITLSNLTRPSAISLSFVMKENDTLSLSVAAATYHKTKDSRFSDKTSLFERTPISVSSDAIIPFSLNVANIKQHSGELFSISKNEGEQALKVGFFFRGQILKGNESLSLVTASLINTNMMAAGEDQLHADYQQCFFQTSFSIRNEKGFTAMPQRPKIFHDEDIDNNDLLYRDIKRYAAGHGCSPIWDDTNPEEPVKQIDTTFIPHYFNKPIVPMRREDLSLSMVDYSNPNKANETFSSLNHLADEYEKWINQLANKKEIIEQFSAAQKNINNCHDYLLRIRNGIALLNSDSLAFHAFCLMNSAMLLQQLHYKLPLRERDQNGNLITPPDFQMPKIDDPQTWYNSKTNVYGQWYPFQIAFILANICSMTDPQTPERSFVDLIWFPTGGGKTEAYLGLSAYTIFLERLSETKNHTTNFGITVLMRYTLRLLTSQQYERATSLICACETLRQADVDCLGQTPISIGLFVGGSTSPNTYSSAAESYYKLQASQLESNPFVVRKCPWCGAELGPSSAQKKGPYSLHGYVNQKKTKNKSEFHFTCDNPECDFYKKRLPLTVIDEDIYNNPPTLLIGTVDKFATLIFNHQSQAIFGYKDGQKLGNPSLIIQDELHLISGPLGSMVAIYETMIDELCTDRRQKNVIKPKIVASTATIAMAREQCHNLFDVPPENVKIFPPSGLSANDSFFAVEKKGSSGREYVGVYAPGAPSVSTAAIRLYSSLFEAPVHVTFPSTNLQDAYYTNVGYYNSLRELGKAETWVSEDIPEHNKVIAGRYSSLERDRQEIRYKELTSRIRSDEIPDNLHALEKSIPNPDTVDICLATSMISVGLDVSRLGLMTVSGQPKTTSEYIQVTSRVGRDSNRPGIVFVLFNPYKPRDKSIFESFQMFHSEFYSFVEPTSVSVFSPQIRRKALAAVLIGLAILMGTEKDSKVPNDLLSNGNIDRAKDVIVRRVEDLDPEEKENTIEQIDSIIAIWKKQNYTRMTYRLKFDGDYSNISIYSDIPLFYPRGAVIPNAWETSSNAVSTSMRDVDGECSIEIWAHQ
jgi:hypothetical protein